VAAGSAEAAKAEVRSAAPSTPGLVGPDSEKASAASENAVTARLLKTKMCYFFEKGKCASTTCRYAHSASELRKQPDLQKTKICKAFAEGNCTEGDRCVFAHGEEQLRVTVGIYKTQMCHFFERGRCLKGDRCNHAHGPEDMRQHLAKAEASRAGGSSASTAPAEASPKAAAATVSSPGNPLSPLPLAQLLGEGAAAAAWSQAQAGAAAGAAAAAQAAAAQAAVGMLGSPPDLNALAWGWNLTNGYGGVSQLSSWGGQAHLDPMASPAQASMLGALASPGSSTYGLDGGYGPTPGSTYFGPSPLPALDSMATAEATEYRDPEALAPLDLSKRLASFSEACSDLSADMRTYAEGSSTSGAAVPSAAGEASQDVPRRVHRI